MVASTTPTLRTGYPTYAVDRTTAPTPCPAPTVGTYSTYSDLQHLQHLQVYSTYSLQQTYSTPLA